MLNFGPSLRCSVHVKLCDFGGASVSSTTPVAGANPDDTRMYSSRPVGSKQYTAPEVLATLDDLSRLSALRQASPGTDQGRPQFYDVKLADVWSFAVTVFVLCSGRAPFKEARASDAHYLAFIKSTQPGMLGTSACPSGSIGREAQESAARIKWIWPRHFTKPLVDMLRGCLSIDPEQRPSMAEVASCEYFFPAAKPRRESSVDATQEPITTGAPAHRSESGEINPSVRSPTSGSRRGRAARTAQGGTGRFSSNDTDGAGSVASGQSSSASTTAASKQAGTSVRGASVCHSSMSEAQAGGLVSPSAQFAFSRDISVTTQRHMMMSPPRGAPNTARGDSRFSQEDALGGPSPVNVAERRNRPPAESVRSTSASNASSGVGDEPTSPGQKTSDSGFRVYPSREFGGSASSIPVETGIAGAREGKSALPPIGGAAACSRAKQPRLSVPSLVSYAPPQPVLRNAHSASSAAMHQGAAAAAMAACDSATQAGQGVSQFSSAANPAQLVVAAVGDTVAYHNSPSAPFSLSTPTASLRQPDEAHGPRPSTSIKLLNHALREQGSGTGPPEQHSEGAERPSLSMRDVLGAACTGPPGGGPTKAVSGAARQSTGDKFHGSSSTSDCWKSENTTSPCKLKGDGGFKSGHAPAVAWLPLQQAPSDARVRLPEL